MKAGSRAPHSDNPRATKETTGYADLLDRAHGAGLKSIRTEILAQPTEENGHRCLVKAVVEVEGGHFEAIGDADPGNVEPFLAPHLIRVAETRAKARALRDAVNCGIVSFDELDGVRPNGSGGSPGSGAPASPPRRSASRGGNGAAPRGARPGTGHGQDGLMSGA